MENNILISFRADYWVSNERKFCEFCKCWITDNKASVSFHENGKRHKAAVAQRITNISRNSAKAEKEKMKMDEDIRKMEEAAYRSYANDISSAGDMTARNINAVIGVSTEIGPSLPATTPGTSKSRGQIDPLRLPGNSDDEDEDGRPIVRKIATSNEEESGSLWIEAKTDENYTYYWNVKTNESIWDAPKEGFMTLDEYNKINQVVIAKQEEKNANAIKSYCANVDEEVARYNREKMKNLRTAEIEKAKKEEEQTRQTYKTEEDLVSPEMGQWQTVVKIEEKQIDWQLPQTNHYIPPQAVTQSQSQQSYEPPIKQFKEKIWKTLSVEGNIPTTFKKRKNPKGNARQRLDTDD